MRQAQRMQSRLPRARAQGFSLLELLVAFVIMAFSLTAIYQASGGSVRQVQDTELHQRANALAESLLALKSVVPSEGWNESGESAGMTWSVRSAPYTTEHQGPTVTPLHQIWLTVSWMDRNRARELVLTTLRPQRLPQAGGRTP